MAQEQPDGRARGPGDPGSQSKALSPSYVSFFSLPDEGQVERFQQSLRWLNGRVEKLGWKRVALGYAVTGPSRQFLEVYRLPESSSLLGMLKTLQQEQEYREMLLLCQSRQLELGHAMPYDRGAGGPDNPLVKPEWMRLLYAVLTVKEGRLNDFITHMKQVQELFHRKEWRLLFATRSPSVPVRVTHLWKFGDTDELQELMFASRREPSYIALDACCVSQWQNLMRDLTAPGAGGEVPP